MRTQEVLKKENIPAPVRELLRTLRQGGYEAYPVGGCVRDLLLGVSPHDWDMTTAATPCQAETALTGWHIVETGIKHGTITVLAGEYPVELTTFRGESGYADGRHPDHVTFGVTLQEDLARREFTIGDCSLRQHWALLSSRRRLPLCGGMPTGCGGFLRNG